MDPAQTMQMLLNQLASSGQLNLHQPTPSTGQPIRQTPLVLSQSNTQNSSRVRISAKVPNPQPRTLEEQPSETPLADIRLIEQTSDEIKSHLKEEVIDQISETLQKQFGIKPK
jgi:hypothetical protein